jgi:hypothetical protein
MGASRGIWFLILVVFVTQITEAQGKYFYVIVSGSVGKIKWVEEIYHYCDFFCGFLFNFVIAQ